MKFKRACAIIAGWLHVAAAAALLVIAVILISGAASCLGIIGDINTGNAEGDMLGITIVGGGMMFVWCIALVIVAIPTIIYLTLGICMIKANGKKIRSTVPPIVALIFSALALLSSASTIAAHFLSPDAIAEASMVTSMISAAVHFVNIVLCAFAYSGIKEQNDILKRQMREDCDRRNIPPIQ